jgi:hypothetical protein
MGKLASIRTTKAPFRRQSWESSPVFNAIEAFFFYGVGQVTVLKQCRRGIAVERVKT